MADELRRVRYSEQRVLIETARVLDSPFCRYLLVVSGGQIELLRNLMQYLGRRSTFVSEYQGPCYLEPDGGDWDKLQAIVADLEDKLMEIALGFYDAYVCVRDKKAMGVHGGTFTTGAWRTRDINEETADADGICSIASNQITLDAGTYRCNISAPACEVNGHQARLYNITDSAVTLVGQCAYSRTTDLFVTHSFVNGRFTLAAQKTLEVQHRNNATKADYGFGILVGVADEIYTLAEFWREA